MTTVMLLLGLLVAATGATVMALAVVPLRRPATDAASYLRSLDEEPPLDEFDQLLSESFIRRVVRPLGSRVLSAISSVTPGSHLQRVHHRLVLAGLTGTVRAEEFVTGQALAGAFGALVAIAWTLLGSPSPRAGIAAVALLPTAGLLVPEAWLKRKVDERHQSIRRDLPDVLDLMAVSVEAGVGFEGAMEVVTRHFDSPLAVELSRTLKEMELGLSRREALQNLKRRTEVPELSNFVLTLTQADALGMPVGRVLKTQAVEMRSRRRQWARETAAKLPVKILFPLVVFIFPAILVVVLGPAAASLVEGLQ